MVVQRRQSQSFERRRRIEVKTSWAHISRGGCCWSSRPCWAFCDKFRSAQPPGGPIEQIIANLEGQGDVFESFAGTGDDSVGGGEAREDYVGARGSLPEFIAELEKEFGFDKPPLERFLQMMWNYLRFDFGESYFRSISVVDFASKKCRCPSHWGRSTLIAYIVSIPLGIRKAVRDGTRFDTYSIIIVAYAIPGFLLFCY